VLVAEDGQKAIEMQDKVSYKIVLIGHADARNGRSDCNPEIRKDIRFKDFRSARRQCMDSDIEKSREAGMWDQVGKPSIPRGSSASCSSDKRRIIEKISSYRSCSEEPNTERTPSRTAPTDLPRVTALTRLGLTGHGKEAFYLTCEKIYR
jgi:hypothetical protein